MSKTKGKETYTFTVEYPSGFSILPYEGGWKDQPHGVFVFFDIFLNAERKRTLESIK